MARSLNSFHKLLLQKGLSFVRFSLPRQTKAITYISYLPKSFHDLKSMANYQKEGFVFAPFFVDEDQPIWFLEADDKVEEVSNLIEDFIEQLPDRDLNWKIEIDSTSKREYTESFEKLMQALNSSKLDKVILSKIIAKPNTGESVFNLFSRLSEAYPRAFTYLIHMPSGEIWLGATPELLLKQDENGIQTMALAGTQLLKNRKPKDIVWENKEIDEQAYVREFVQQVLSSVSDSVTVSNTYSATAGNVVHLQTDFAVNQSFDRLKIIDIVEKLHPTPAVCGIPLEESRAYILNTEQHNRSYYTGFLGPVNRDSMSLFVNLRCMQVMSDKYALYVGGGITRDSNLEKEWQETEAKAQTLLSVID